MAISKEFRNVYVDTRAWMVREHLFRIDQYKAGAARPAYSSVRTKSILGTSLPRTWGEYQKLRELYFLKDSHPSDRLRLKLGQAALLSCAWAQSAYIWNSLSQRHDVKSAGKESMHELDYYAETIEKGKRQLPSKQLLHLALDQALTEENGDVDAYSRPASVLRTVVGLTIVGLQEHTPKGRDVVFPAPGRAFGEVYPWVPPRLQQDVSPRDLT